MELSLGNKKTARNQWFGQNWQTIVMESDTS